MIKIDEMADVLEAAAALFFPNTNDKIAHRSPISNAAFDRDCILKSLQLGTACLHRKSCSS